MKKARKPTTAWKQKRDQVEGEAEERRRPGGKGKPRKDRDLAGRGSRGKTETRRKGKPRKDTDQAEGEAEERQRPGGKGKPRKDRDQAGRGSRGKTETGQEGEAEEKDSDSTGQHHGAKTTHGSDLIYSNLTPESQNIKLHRGKHPTTCHSQ